MINQSKRLPSAVTTITPQRISFVGGGTDLPAFYTNHGGGVISSAINQYVYVTVKHHSPLFEEAYRGFAGLIRTGVLQQLCLGFA
jgi:D-glycero-alpha-D-manno-heptose-7-phosphate kinase